MKIKALCALVLAFSLVLASCGMASKNQKFPTLKDEHVKTNADLTGDGLNEAIITYVSHNEKEPSYVLVGTKTDKWIPLYQIFAGTNEAKQRGIYICKRNGEFCLMIWEPNYDKKSKTTTLSYEVFKLKYNTLKKEGEPVSLESETVSFTDAQIKEIGSDKYIEATSFVKKLNRYISVSSALLDTVGGETVFSPKANEVVTKSYEPEWYNPEYRIPSKRPTLSSDNSSSDETESTEESSNTSGTDSDDTATDEGSSSEIETSSDATTAS